MNKTFSGLIGNLFRAVSVNVARLIISVLMTLLLPFFLGVEEYSNWQLYLFYLTYVVFSSLGWSEGLYLRYGGQQYCDLNNKEVAGLLWAEGAYEISLSFVCWVFLALFVHDAQKLLILRLALISAFFDILRFSLQCILQATNRIREYSFVAGVERVLFFLFAIAVLAIGRRDFQSLIGAEIAARILSLILAIVLCRKVIFKTPPAVAVIWENVKRILRTGMTVLLANAASQLILGVIRFAIERKWGTIVFGKVSLTLSMANMLIVCVSAASIVLFPLLKRMQPDRMVQIYDDIRTLVTTLILLLLLLYSPIERLLELWLPQYQDSLKYLVVLMPIGVYETRSYVLTDTYFKAVQRTDRLLLINLATCVLSVGLAVVSVVLMQSLDMAVLSLLVLVAFKNTLAECMLSPLRSGRTDWKSMVMEFTLVAVFVCCNWTMKGIVPSLVYLLALSAYLLASRKKIATTVTSFRQMFVKTAVGRMAS